MSAPQKNDGISDDLVSAEGALRPFGDEGPQQIPNSRVNTILINSLGQFVPPDANDESTFKYRALIVDKAYITVSPVWVKNAILADPVLSPERYKNDVFDCDDYVQYLRVRMALYAANHDLSFPLALGYLFTKKHAFSFCLDHDRSLWLINTQSDAKAMTNDLELFVQFLEYSRSNPITHIYI
jgi:hypothetical protein